MATSTLRIPEKSGQEILLTYKLVKSDAQLDTSAKELVLEVISYFFRENRIVFFLTYNDLIGW